MADRISPIPGSVLASCGVLVEQDDGGRFRHLASCWCIGPQEWVTVWSGAQPPRSPRLIHADSGRHASLSDWEVDADVIGFRCDLGVEVAPLPVSRGHALHKRDPLRAVGFPDLIDHPAFALSRGSLDPDRYVPYLCPWLVQGHLGVFNASDGFLAGASWAGMAGGPVLGPDDQVVGILLDGINAPGQPPLSRFRRLA